MLSPASFYYFPIKTAEVTANAHKLLTLFCLPTARYAICWPNGTRYAICWANEAKQVSLPRGEACRGEQTGSGP